MATLRTKEGRPAAEITRYKQLAHSLAKAEFQAVPKAVQVEDQLAQVQRARIHHASKLQAAITKVASLEKQFEEQRSVVSAINSELDEHDKKYEDVAAKFVNVAKRGGPRESVAPSISLDALLAGSVDAFDIDFGSTFDVDGSTLLVEQDDINELNARRARFVAVLQSKARKLFQSAADTVKNAKEAHRALVTRLSDKKRKTNDARPLLALLTPLLLVGRLHRGALEHRGPLRELGGTPGPRLQLPTRQQGGLCSPVCGRTPLALPRRPLWPRSSFQSPLPMAFDWSSWGVPCDSWSLGRKGFFRFSVSESRHHFKSPQAGGGLSR
ncbi:unnamed protein product [Prorocentrum cordatum]|uniref:Uncharacterized protein n=1 Tax=Prorocentrum cordatum TaxID=2364126 RepID=A0ABN9RRV4_9DINO|nr:unnamed protein product [Polarella glacialis]